MDIDESKRRTMRGTLQLLYIPWAQMVPQKKYNRQALIRARGDASATFVPFEDSGKPLGVPNEMIFDFYAEIALDVALDHVSNMEGFVMDMILERERISELRWLVACDGHACAVLEAFTILKTLLRIHQCGGGDVRSISTSCEGCKKSCQTGCAILHKYTQAMAAVDKLWQRFLSDDKLWR